MMVDVKDICHEPVFLKAVPVKCEISSVPSELGLATLRENLSTTVPQFKDANGDTQECSWIEVRINDDFSISSSEVVERVCSILSYFFNVKNRHIGFGGFNTSDIQNMIMDKMPSVSEIYTVFKEDADSNPIYTRGLSMSAFITNTSLINLGDDLQTKTGNIHLEEFMYPTFYTNTENELKKRIKVVNKNINILSKNNY